MSSRKFSRPQAISYYEINEFDKSRTVKGPINFDVFEKRYRSNEWPSVNYKTQIWNGNQYKQWTPVYANHELLKRLDPKRFKELKQLNSNPKHTKHTKPTNKDKHTHTHTTHNGRNGHTHTTHNGRNGHTPSLQKPQTKNSPKTDTVHSAKTQSIPQKLFHHCCPLSFVSLELLKWLIISRSAIFFGVFILTYFDLLPQWDSSGQILTKRSSGIEHVSLKYLSHFSNWDGQYFLHIARFGYEHEKIYAFYPGLPLLLNSLIIFVRKYVCSHMHFKCVALLCGVLWNGLISSFLAAVVLYYLTLKMYNNGSIALMSAKLFLINPASIFFASIYTESTFALVTFLLMLCCELKYFNVYIHGSHHLILTVAIVFTILIATSLRSNGVLVCLFPIYCHIYSNWFNVNGYTNALSWLRYYVCKYLRNGPSNISEFDVQINAKIFINRILRFIGTIVLLCIGIAPMIAFQWFGKHKLCAFIKDRNYCHYWWSTVYSFVQTHYWQCGLFKRWKLTEIGNFMLAFPIWFISFHGFKDYFEKMYLISLFPLKYSETNNNQSLQCYMNHFMNGHSHSNGHSPKIKNGKNGHSHPKTPKNGQQMTVSYGLKLLRSMGMIENGQNIINNSNSSDKFEILTEQILLNHKLIPYILYWFVLVIICLFYAHVQISTRFICCSCPPLYWFCAKIILCYNGHSKSHKKNKKTLWDNLSLFIRSKPSPNLILSYFLLYFAIGTMAFAAFLPFV